MTVIYRIGGKNTSSWLAIRSHEFLLYLSFNRYLKTIIHCSIHQSPSVSFARVHSFLIYAMISGSRLARRHGLLKWRNLCCRCYSEAPLRPPQEWLEGKPVRGQWDSDENSPEQHERTLLQRRRVFSGIQPTGVPHLGNYLGALRQWKLLHDSSANTKLLGDTKHDQFFSVVDLHALTSSDVPGHVRRQLRRESYASLMAIGLQNTQQTTLFFQSDASQAFLGNSTRFPELTVLAGNSTH